MVLFTIELRSWLHSFWKQQETVCFSAFFCFQGLLVFLSLWPFYHCATWEAPRTICIKMHGDQRDQNVDGKANNLIRLGFGGGGQWCGKEGTEERREREMHGEPREEAHKGNGRMLLGHMELGSFVSLLAFSGRKVNSSLHFFRSVCMCAHVL